MSIQKSQFIDTNSSQNPPLISKKCIAITTLVALVALRAIVVGALAIQASLQGGPSSLGALSQMGWQAGVALIVAGLILLIASVVIHLMRYYKKAKAEQADLDADNTKKTEIEKTKLEAEDKKKAEAQEKAKLEAEEKKKSEAAEKARLEVEDKKQAEAAEKVRLESEQKKDEEKTERHKTIINFLHNVKKPTEEQEKTFLEFVASSKDINDFLVGNNRVCHFSMAMIAAKRGITKFIKILGERGANFEIQDLNGNTPLLWAIANAENEAALEIINFSQNFNFEGYGNTALFLAVLKGYETVSKERQQLTVSNYQLVAALLKKGADPNIRNKKGYTPLHIAVLRRQEKMVKVLLENGAKIDFDWKQALEQDYNQVKAILDKHTIANILDQQEFDSSKDKIRALLQTSQNS